MDQVAAEISADPVRARSQPAFLWQASHQKYLQQQRLVLGLESRPDLALREEFKAAYVLCGTPPLNRQMQDDPRHFAQITGTEPMILLRMYRVAP